MIDERGGYKSMMFKKAEEKPVRGKKETVWRLIGSESNGQVMGTLDTFTNDKGSIKTYTRRQIDEQIELGNITAVI